MQDLKPIRVFLEVAKLQSFAAAARTLRLTPASVTRIVARLEEDLGQQLLVRTTRQVSLTSAGALVASRYRPLVEALDRVSDDLNRELQPFHGRIAINAPVSFGLRLLPPLLDRFTLAYPNVDLTIQLTDRLVDIVTESCDLSIRLSRPPVDRSTIWRKLCKVPLRAVASPRLFERHPLPRTPDDLNPRLCLSYGAEESPEAWQFRKGAVTQTVFAGTAIHSNNGDLLYEMARAGAGIVVLPEFHVAEGLGRGDVVPVLADWSLPHLWLSLYYPPYEALPPLVATFSDFLEAFLGDVTGFEFSG
ncbi:LysR family transcriptional regulator [Paracoccus zhejiangensis]|uniref:LysR family transcriptional regulator n=1 Tax=Paracoccus zhejiangensis TaxID=1077935 RepID=A0A2H5EWT3_9RHOB|nr:LysR family transcriptional regulator [Paracoccus zhejiangensis]AUH63752.1 LysR family transcriptional regulator [Paracoccus zhejiangensis]